jgi:urea transport system permease protein
MADRDATQKITVNNSLRTSLRKTIGRLELKANDVKVRINAVHAIAKAIDEEGLVLLRDRLAIEQDSAVQNERRIQLRSAIAHK